MNLLPTKREKEPIAEDNIVLHSTDEGSRAKSIGKDGQVLNKGPWTSAEDAILIEYVKKHGEGNWNAVQKNSGLSRCGKSCRLRWANHLKPNLKKGAFTMEEEEMIIQLHAKMGNKWAKMATFVSELSSDHLLRLVMCFCILFLSFLFLFDFCFS
ncbi:hypothetical protein GW17_00006441 [Ensete ventricosum]|nr:hypothetical protein GW17_00006441 [Ensete ventricosum]RZS01451.1 hypothetical protein BHM03_00031292 [Ensete ventricosum]